MFPKLGSTFCFPINKTQFGSCRVLRVEKKEIMFASSCWIGEEEPDISEPLLRQTIVLTMLSMPRELAATHYLRRADLGLAWLERMPVPVDFKLIGYIEPTADEKRLRCQTFGGWKNFAENIEGQRLWDLDRDEYYNWFEARQQKQVPTTPKRCALSMEQMLKLRLFKDWHEIADADVVKECRQVIRETIREIQKIGEGNIEKKKAVLLGCVKYLAAVSEENDYFIDTFERDEVCDLLERICVLSGIDEEMNFSSYL